MALAGVVGLRMLADRSGLTGTLSQVLTVRGFTPVHDRGQVLTDVAVAIGCGGRDLVDVEALRAQQQVFGPVASDTTAGRALGQVGDRRRTAIARARAAARAHVWAQLPDGVPESRFVGGQHQPDTVVLRIDGTLIAVHSKKDKEQHRPNDQGERRGTHASGATAATPHTRPPKASTAID